MLVNVEKVVSLHLIGSCPPHLLKASVQGDRIADHSKDGNIVQPISHMNRLAYWNAHPSTILSDAKPLVRQRLDIVSYHAVLHCNLRRDKPAESKLFYEILTEKVGVVGAEDHGESEAQELVNGFADVPHHRDLRDFS